jgi:hypothetical protein
MSAPSTELPEDDDRHNCTGRASTNLKNLVIRFAVLDGSVRIPPRQCLDLSIDYQM